MTDVRVTGDCHFQASVFLTRPRRRVAARGHHQPLRRWRARRASCAPRWGARRECGAPRRSRSPPTPCPRTPPTSRTFLTQVAEADAEVYRTAAAATYAGEVTSIERAARRRRKTNCATSAVRKARDGLTGCGFVSSSSTNPPAGRHTTSSRAPGGWRRRGASVTPARSTRWRPASWCSASARR